MEAATDVVRPIREGQEKPRQSPPPAPESAESRSRRNLGKAALFVSVLSVILVVVFFFGLNQNISGLTAEVGKVARMGEDMAAMNARLAAMEEKMAAVDAVPAEVKRALVLGMLQDLTQRTGRLAVEMESDEQSAKLNQAMALMQEVQQALGK